jgi:hypothetical protein
MGRAATLRGIVRARSKHPSMANAPGTTVAQKGIQVRTLKSTGRRDRQEVVEEFVVDIGPLDQKCDYLRQIPNELGEGKQVIEHGDKVAASPALIAFWFVTAEEFAAIEKRPAANWLNSATKQSTPS